MFRDARKVEDRSKVTADLCVIGGGAAGITLALGVKDAGFSTVVVEAGGFEHDDASQAVYKGKVDSDVLGGTYLSTSRLRRFGGTTNHWGGHSVVINANIHGPRAGVPIGVWPLSADELRPYYHRAAQVLGMKRPVSERWQPQPHAGLVPMERYAVTEPNKRFGSVYRTTLEQAPLQVLLHASVTALNPTANGARIRDVTVQTLAGNRFSVRAKAFVLATGAIENARLLLLPTPTHPRGVGNEHDLVGRYFADHLFMSDRIIETVPSWSGGRGRFFTFSSALQEAHEIPEIGVLRKDPKRLGRSPTYATFSGIAGLMDQSAEPVLTRVTYYIEPLPDADNRVRLSDDRDPFGQPRTALRFNVGSATRDGFARAVRLLASLAGRHGLGRVHYRQQDPFGILNHHMSTTRMSDDPHRGVVDANCKVHDVANLLVAGSSVFPSTGCGNPTFPLIALAARLADHLVDGFKRRAFE